MSNERNAFEHPKCGDIWKLSDGSYLLVDYSDPLQTGFTTSVGERGGFNYTWGFERWLKYRGATLFRRGEESDFPADCTTKEASMLFLKEKVG